MAKALPTLQSIANAALKSAAGEEVRAATLWAQSPVLVFALRRPGCVLCRATAKKVGRRLATCNPLVFLRPPAAGASLLLTCSLACMQGPGHTASPGSRELLGG